MSIDLGTSVLFCFSFYFLPFLVDAHCALEIISSSAWDYNFGNCWERQTRMPVGRTELVAGCPVRSVQQPRSAKGDKGGQHQGPAMALIFSQHETHYYRSLRAYGLVV